MKKHIETKKNIDRFNRIEKIYQNISQALLILIFVFIIISLIINFALGDNSLLFPFFLKAAGINVVIYILYSFLYIYIPRICPICNIKMIVDSKDSNNIKIKCPKCFLDVDTFLSGDL